MSRRMARHPEIQGCLDRAAPLTRGEGGLPIWISDSRADAAPASRCRCGGHVP